MISKQRSLHLAGFLHRGNIKQHMTNGWFPGAPQSRANLSRTGQGRDVYIKARTIKISWSLQLSWTMLSDQKHGILDESTARRQLKSPRSLSGRCLHLTLVTKWSRSHMTLKIQISRSWPRFWPWPWPWYCQIWGLEFKSICLLFVLWQSDHFWLRYSKFHIWPWKFKVKAKVKSDGHIWDLEFNRCVRYSFRGNRTIFGRDIANSIFDLENSRSRSWHRSNLMVTFEVLRSIDMFAFRFLAIGPFLAEI